MKLQRLLSLTRQAVDDYSMIDDNDKIAIGISGGKDSLTLLYSLANLRKFYPKKFDVIAITIDLGFDGFNTEGIKQLCAKLDIPYYVVKTDIGKIVFEERNEKNPCSLCSKMRKGALDNKALELGCNKVAYGHHKDDVIETMMMSLIYEGIFHTFSPVTHLDNTGLTLIRPLIYVYEADVVGLMHLYELPVSKNPCHADKKTVREYAHDLIAEINHKTPGVKERLFNAVIEGQNDYKKTSNKVN